MGTPPLASGPKSTTVGLAPTSCATCMVRRQCGGHPLEIIQRIGCANFANGAPPVNPNSMNPIDDDAFWAKWDDVGGLLDFTIASVTPVNSSDLPTYIPLLQHCYSRRAVLNVEIIALHLWKVFKRDRDGRYVCRFRDGAHLRAAYRLHPDTKILLSGVAIDRHLEVFWAEHRKANLAAQLARLGICGVTTPNFSFFTDVTGFQILRNFRRILLTAERLSAAGIPVAIHLNAITDRNWELWYDLLSQHSNSNVVALEFQTGLAVIEEGRKTLERVAELQQKLGRLLHPILVGGAKHYLEAEKLFHRFSVVDSRPFMEAQARTVLTREVSGAFRWRKTVEGGRYIDRHLESNLALYPEKLKVAPVDEIEPTSDAGQFEFFDTRPYFTAQPVA